MTFDEFEQDGSGAAPENRNPETSATPPENVVPETSATPPENVVPETPAAPPEDFTEPPETEERPAWSEPVYEPATGVNVDAYTPGQYAYGVQSVRVEPEEPKKKKKKEKKPHRFLWAACVVLVCALVSGLASFAVVKYMVDHNVGGINNKQVVMGGSLSSIGDNIPDENPTPGATLTGNQIYELGCQQVVGVNTSYTVNNFFGMSTTNAVSGSGFIISEDGYILTNYHVISYAVVYDGDLSVLLYDGTKYDAKIVGYLESNDVAVIKIDANGLKPVTLGDSDKMLVGDAIYAIGNPLGELEYTITEGIVSARDRVISMRDEMTNAKTSINMFQISAAVNAGNSGGPVYNSRGEVIGMVTSKYNGESVESLGFAIPINDASSIARQLIETGAVAGAGLGIKGGDVTGIFNEIAMQAYNIPYGVYVDSVNAGSAAEAAGIQVKDIIIAVGGKEVASLNELHMALRRYAPGDTDTITVYRMDNGLSGGEKIDLTITFEEIVEENTTQQQQQQQQQEQQSGGWFQWPFG